MSTTTPALTKIDLSKVLEDMFLVLTPKEKEVVTRRFSLHAKQRETLDKIGKSFGVTRERIRQIEKIALKKLRRTVNTTAIKRVIELSHEILAENGQVMNESMLVARILNISALKEDVDGYIIKLALAIDPDTADIVKSDTRVRSWRMADLDEKIVLGACDAIHKSLSQYTDVVVEDELLAKAQEILAKKYQQQPLALLRSCLFIDKRLKQTSNGWGLMIWRHINPKSLRDKSYIVLKSQNKPMHFMEIANAITEARFDKKVVTVQAVHNELIRGEQFVLVGRGLYALSEWGYEAGTVGDVIEGILKKAKRPVSKQEIVEGVMKVRNVKEGTISLNLQKNNRFSRVGRAMYVLDEKAKA